MHVFARTFWVPKESNSETEYEDAFWPRKSVLEAKGPRFRFAVADGATETSFAKIWARQLVHAFCSGFLDESSLSTHLPKLQRRWSTIVRKRPLPWYAEEKLNTGAFASILGLLLEDAQTRGRRRRGRWSTIAVGDSCVVQVRDDQVLARFPLECSDSFTNRPRLLSSNPAHTERVSERLSTKEGIWVTGDAFYLMTDALAWWFMKEVEEERTPWHILRDLDTADQDMSFRRWISDLREEKRIRNDDVTLLRVDIA